MKIFIGSKNQNKINAVIEIVKDYKQYSDSEFSGKQVNSEVSEQPISLDETIMGAKNRAYNAYENGSLSFGIEDGLIKVPHTKTGFMNVCVCAIYDGKDFHIGLSSAFESPKKVMNHILLNNFDMSEAYFQAGFTKNKNLGKFEGPIGILTKNRLLRLGYTKQAVLNAMIHLDNNMD